MRAHFDRKFNVHKKETDEQISELQACIDLLLKHHDIQKPLSAGKKLAIINKAFKPTRGLNKWARNKHKLLISAQKLKNSKKNNRRKSYKEMGGGFKPAADVLRVVGGGTGASVHPK